MDGAWSDESADRPATADQRAHGQVPRGGGPGQAERAVPRRSRRAGYWVRLDPGLEMALDAEGYGYGSHEEGLERLLTDARVLSPAGIERAAWGWDRHEDPRLMQRFHDAERAGLRALEKSDRGPQWEEARRRILELTEGRT